MNDGQRLWLLGWLRTTISLASYVAVSSRRVTPAPGPRLTPPRIHGGLRRASLDSTETPSDQCRASEFRAPRRP
jgi:hypothetical protein